MPATFDVIVLGVGGVGSAALAHLAARGLRVLGLERFGVAHDRGSSHGETRIIRKAYFEHPDYVPLLNRAYELWAELEAATGTRLYQETGLILAGPPDGEAVPGALESARRHGVTIDELPLAEARGRFRRLRFPDGHAVVFEPQAGFLRVEECVAAHIQRACSSGAQLRTGERVTGWDAGAGGVTITTDAGSYSAGALVITAGAWAGPLLSAIAPAPAPALPLTVLRKVQFWHAIRDPGWSDAPAFFFEQPEGCFYGFPSIDGGRTIKLAEHTGGTVVADPVALDRGCHEEDIAPVRRFIESTLHDVSPAATRHAACMYTMTPDGHFIVDRHPEHAAVVFAAGLSGHGFKFTSVLGAALADLATEGTTPLPVGFLAARDWTAPGPATEDAR